MHSKKAYTSCWSACISEHYDSWGTFDRFRHRFWNFQKAFEFYEVQSRIFELEFHLNDHKTMMETTLVGKGETRGHKDKDHLKK